MIVKKLTLTPITSGYSKIVRFEPDINSATLLIKERLSIGYNRDNIKVPRACKKLLPTLRGWINPNTLVINETGRFC